MSSYTSDIIAFFQTATGQQFYSVISGIIDSKHQKGEDNPELARDYMQQAKGVREVVNLVDSIKAGGDLEQ